MYDRSEMEGYDYSEMSLDRWISILRKAEHSKHKIMGPVYVTFYEDNIMNKFLSANSMVEFAVHIEDTSSTDDIRDFGDFDAVTMIHIGNYEDIPTSYIQMMKWIRPAGRLDRPEESPGFTEAWQLLTAAGGDPRDSATEIDRRPQQAVRMERRGKSSPAHWRLCGYVNPARSNIRK